MIKFIVGLLGLMGLASCEKVIDVELDNVEPRFVIEATITNEPGPFYVTIATTVDFNAPNEFPGVPGAVVTFTDETTAFSETLQEVSVGRHRSELTTGIPGHTYRLDVTIAGELFTGRSTMPVPVPLDSVTFRTGSRLGNTRILAIPNFEDPVGTGNQYLFTQYINSVRFTRSVFVFEDRLSDGRNVTQPLFMDSSFIIPGDTVSIEMASIDRPVYDYFNTFQGVISGSEPASPANPLSNLSGNALGYFSARSVDRKWAVAR